MGRFIPGRIHRLRQRLHALDRLHKLEALDQISRRLDDLAQSVGRVEARQLAGIRSSLQEHEFRVYSHAGEDGIIEFLIGAIEIPSRTFVEFGVEDYREANTRFLLQHHGWRGLVIDGSSPNIKAIQADPISWNFDLRAVDAFVTRENIDQLLVDNGFAGELGLLSIDIDGNDYWIFDAISAARPAIAVVEYNHRFGPSRSVTIPYNASYVRDQSNSTWLVTGASLAAIVNAAARKGMSFVGCNSFGNNAFFVRTDLKPTWLPSLSAEEGFAPGRFREWMVVDGRQVMSSASLEAELVAAANLVDVP